MVFITDEHDLLKINNSGKYGYAYQKSSTPFQGAILFFLRFSPKSIFYLRNLLFTGVILR